MSILSLLFLAAIVLIVMQSHRSGKQPPGNPQQPPAQNFIPKQVETSQQAEPPRNTAPQNPYEALYPPRTPAPQIPAPPPPPPKPFSPLPLLLFAGVAFLFLGGIIFLTDTWEMLSDPVRALALLSASGVAFGMHLLSDRVLKLQKTGLAFYTLGSIFLPMAIGAIGVFGLFGEWFSINGDGVLIMVATIFLSSSIAAFAGLRPYRNAVLAGLGIISAAMAWYNLALFICTTDPMKMVLTTDTRFTLFAAALAFSSIMLAMCGRLLRTQDSPIARALPGSTCIVLLIHTLTALFLLPESTAAPLLLSLTLMVLYLDPQYIRHGSHRGVIGFLICSLILFGKLSSLAPDDIASGFSEYLFTVNSTAMLLICIGLIPQLHAVTRATFSALGYTAALFTLPSLFVYPDITADASAFLYVPMFLALCCFGNTQRNRLSRDAAALAVLTPMLYSMTLGSADLFSRLLLCTVLLGIAMLLGVFALTRKRWCLALALCTCGAILITRLPHPDLLLSWYCTAAFLGAAFYAHQNRRPLLERCCVWAGTVQFMTACGGTALLQLDISNAQSVAFLALLLVYVSERFAFRTHERSAASCRFCICTAVYMALLSNNFGMELPWILLTILCLFGFSAAALRRDVNFLSIPLFLITCLKLDDLLALLPIAGHTAGEVLFYLCILAVFVLLGRLLLPRFYTADNQLTQIDWALLAAAIPVSCIASAIGWHPQILTSLLLAAYSLLFIGRMRQRYLPAAMVSLFLSIALFQCLAENVLNIRTAVSSLALATPGTLLFLLPIHLFLLSLVFILPKQHRDSLHVAWFLACCLTMLFLLSATLYSGMTFDAIITALLSLSVLLASIAAKRIRWFALGFGVLLLITLRMTFTYRHSIHWGVYLFLIGAALLLIALRYEYRNRWKAEHPNEPMKKFQLFKEWKW